MTNLLTIISTFLFSFNSQGDQLIVKFKEGVTPQKIAKKFAVSEVLSPTLNIYLVETNSHWQDLTNDPSVAYAQPNHKVTPRQSLTPLKKDKLPNDTEFASQWSLINSRKAGADIGAVKAWSLGTGGKDKLGNEIVVAVIDGGVDISHPDLKENIWANQNEVPDNGVDDDGNGYIDDIHGWDIDSESGKVAAKEHGTHVAGIAGAKGNNNSQVSGVNWDVKIMSVTFSGQAGVTASVIKAYSYITAQKKLWLETAGAKGANVVSTNSSFGIDYGNCNSDEYKVWNDLYNEMGKYGILSAGATANIPIDIDHEGDVPTGCSSPYLISVTNTTELDEINTGAAFGKINVDLGAPGTEVLSTILKGEINLKTGTSMATPHVAGGIALLHHHMSKNLAQLFISQPSDAALKLKDLILQTVDVIDGLKDVTVSGGRLNIYKAGLKANVWK